MTQQGLTDYYSYMGNSRLRGISVPGAQGLPQWCREVANHVSYFQLYYSQPWHVADYKPLHRSPITMHCLYAASELPQNAITKNLRKKL